MAYVFYTFVILECTPSTYKNKKKSLKVCPMKPVQSQTSCVLCIKHSYGVIDLHHLCWCKHTV